MKKLILLIVIALAGYTKGYSQLMQSNSLGPSAKPAMVESIPRLSKINFRSDSLVTFTPKIDTAYLHSVKEYKLVAAKIDIKTHKIDSLASVRSVSVGAANVALQRKINALSDEKTDLTNQLKILQDDSKRALTENYALHDQINDLVINKYNTLIVAIDTELTKHKTEIGQKRKKALSNFDTVIRSSSAKYQHVIDSISNIMNLNSYIVQTRLSNNVSPQRDSINKYLLDLKLLKADVAKYTNIQDEVYLRSVIAIQNLDRCYKTYLDTVKAFTADFNTYVERTNKNIDDLNAIALKIKKEADAQATQAETVSALGGINKIFGDQGVLSPTISLVGQKKFTSDANSSIYGEVKLFAGGNDDDKKNTGVNKLFVPEASTYGFMTDFSFGFIGADKKSKYDEVNKYYEQKLAINVGVYYLGKKLQPDTLTSVTTNLFHVKLGLQYILIPHVLSVYLNTNQLLVTTNIEKFEKYYKDATRVRSFTSFGMQSYLDLNEKSDFHLFIDLGFVNINNDVNSWLKTADTLIPTVKLSLVKTFSF